MSNARRYRDNGGRVWETRGNHYMAHLVQLAGGDVPARELSSPLTRVRETLGPLTPVTNEDNAGKSVNEDTKVARYIDRDGDVWTEQGDGTLRLTKSYAVPGSEGIRYPFRRAVSEYGPMVYTDTGARYGPGSEMPDDSKADEDVATVGQRAEALTVGVMLAKIVHGDEGHAANLAGTADTFARFILGER